MQKLTGNTVKLLKMAEKKTNEMLTRKNWREMERKKKLLITKLEEIQELKTNVTE